MAEETYVSPEAQSSPEEAVSPEIPTPTRPQPVPVGHYIRTIAIIVVILAADQILKIWVKTHMEMGEQRSLMGHWAFLHFIENNGIAFGYELPPPWGKVLLTTFRIIAAGAIFAYLLRLIKRHVSQGLIIAGALVFAGATGNIFDSIFYGVAFKNNLYTGGWFYGRVVDMLYFPIVDTTLPHWIPFFGGSHFSFFDPIFNLADASITVGILMILLFYRRALKSL